MNESRCRLPVLLSWMILVGALPAFAEQSRPSFHFIPPNSVNLREAIGDPPAPGSPSNALDLETVLKFQAARTKADIARAQSEEKLDPSVFREVLGKSFTAGNFPLTFALLDRATADAVNIAGAGKNLWKRPRPPLQSVAVHPAVKVPESASYPSFHATRGTLWAAILEKLAPLHLRERIKARGDEIGRDRVIAGVHFPTDVAAGQKLGRVIAERLFDNAGFMHDLAGAGSEWRQKR